MTVLRRDQVNIRTSGHTAILTDLDTVKGTVAGARIMAGQGLFETPFCSP